MTAPQQPPSRDQWGRAWPAQQQPYYGPPPQQWQPASPAPVTPAPPQPKTNIAAIVAITAGLLGLFVLPIVLGPVAVIAGFVGEHLARKEDRKLGRIALLAILLGGICTYLAVDRLGGL